MDRRREERLRLGRNLGEGVRLQFFQADELQRRGVGRGQIDRRRDPAIERFLPALHADAPFIARLKAGKLPFGMRRDQVIALEHGVIEKVARSLDANCVQTGILRSRPAVAVTIESGHRFATAAL